MSRLGLTMCVEGAKNALQNNVVSKSEVKTLQGKAMLAHQAMQNVWSNGAISLPCHVGSSFTYIWNLGKHRFLGKRE